MKQQSINEFLLSFILASYCSTDWYLEIKTFKGKGTNVTIKDKCNEITSDLIFQFYSNKYLKNNLQKLLLNFIPETDKSKSLFQQVSQSFFKSLLELKKQIKLLKTS